MLRIQIPDIGIYTVDRDSGKLVYNGPTIKKEKGFVVSEETPQQKLNSVFIFLKNILLNDSNLTNYSRYIDYGSIKKIVSNGTTFFRWITEPCILNEDNKANVTQLIRIVKTIDTKFLDYVRNYDSQLENTSYSYGNDDLKQKDILFNIRHRRFDENYRNRYNDYQELIIRMMVNIDCKFNIKGTSLTVFDFIGKNLNTTDKEENFYKYDILKTFSKIILVGNKGYVLAVIDRLHHVFVSALTLRRIYELDTTADKCVFSSIVLKLFNTLNTFCIYMLTTTISTYFSNQFTTSIVKDIFQNCDFSVNDKMTLYNITNFKFSDNKEDNSYIRSSINGMIHDAIANFLNRETYIDCMNISKFMTEYKDNISKRNEAYATLSFKNGLLIGRSLMDLGWEYVKDRGTIKGKYSSYFLETEHIYFKKRLDEIPVKAVVRMDGVVKFRQIKDQYVNEFSRYYDLRIYELILDITTGTLICDGKHPNVSRSAVCMGDLKGMVVFNGKSQDEIRELIERCEELLRVINYTSSYSDTGLNYFTSTTYSMNCDGLISTENQQEAEKNSRDEVADLDSADMTDYSDDNEDELEEEDIEELSENSNENNSEYSDRESVNDEDDYEEDEES